MTAMNTPSKPYAIPATIPFIEYGTCAQKNSIMAMTRSRSEMEWSICGKMNHLLSITFVNSPALA